MEWFRWGTWLVSPLPRSHIISFIFFSHLSRESSCVLFGFVWIFSLPLPPTQRRTKKNQEEPRRTQKNLIETAQVGLQVGSKIKVWLSMVPLKWREGPACRRSVAVEELKRTWLKLPSGRTFCRIRQILVLVLVLVLHGGGSASSCIFSSEQCNIHYPWIIKRIMVIRPHYQQLST